MLKTSLALIAALTTVGACNNDKTQRAANRAAQEVNDKTDELKDEAKDLRETAQNENNELADKIQDNRNELEEDIKDVADNMKERAKDTADKAGDGVERISDETDDVTAKVGEVAEADAEFLVHKSIRIATLRGVHAIAASQPMLINLVNDSIPFNAEDKKLIEQKNALFISRLSEAANAISGLDAVDAKTWSAQERAAAEALNRVEDARVDAFEALADAKRASDRTSMR